MSSLKILTATLAMISFGVCRANTLQQQVEKVVASKQAIVGVAIIGEGGNDVVVVNGNYRYPMQSTYKFHLALAVLNMVDSGRLSLEQKIYVAKNDLLPGTHSPLREKYPKGNVSISLKEILQYTVSQSDNNGCDILFRLMGGPKPVNDYIHKLGIDHVNIVANEAEMHKDNNLQFENWTTPLAAARLLEKFYQREVLSSSNYELLWRIMVETSTGANRLKGLLPQGTIVAHKTGSGPRSGNVTSACNDIGIVQLPNGKHLTIVVLVANSKESEETNERIIAEVAKTVWDYFTKEK